MLFHCRQTQACVLSNLFVASPLTRQLRNFPFATREAGQAWQAEKPESPGSLAAPANIFTGDEKMLPRHANGIDLLEVNGRPQVWLAGMIHFFFFEVGSASHTRLWLCIPPFLLENTAPIQNFGGHRRIRLSSSGFLGSLFPHCTEIPSGVVLINRFQVPTQNNCGKRQAPKELFKISSHRSFAFEGLNPTKRGEKLRVKFPKQFYFGR
jgi:hypothetical protein